MGDESHKTGAFWIIEDGRSGDKLNACPSPVLFVLQPRGKDDQLNDSAQLV
jgi:hypothetical protein